MLCFTRYVDFVMRERLIGLWRHARQPYGFMPSTKFQFLQLDRRQIAFLLWGSVVKIQLTFSRHKAFVVRAATAKHLHKSFPLVKKSIKQKLARNFRLKFRALLSSRKLLTSFLMCSLVHFIVIIIYYT